MLNQLRQIVIFSKTVEHGSFRKAAIALNLSPSVVSHHIAKLEEQLGVALLYRSTRKLSLTSDGETLLISAHAMIEAAESFFSAASNQSAELIGTLNIALPAVMQQSQIVNQIGEFSKMHSGVNLQLNFSDTQSDIINERIDVAIRMGRLKDSTLKANKLFDIERYVVASSDYVNAITSSKQTTIEEVVKWDWIELSPVGLINLFSFSKASNKTFRPKSRIKVNSATAMFQLILNNNGIAALPQFLVQDEIDRGRFVHILPDVKIKPIGVYAVWPPNAPKGGLAYRLIEHLKAVQWHR